MSVICEQTWTDPEILSNIESFFWISTSMFLLYVCYCLPSTHSNVQQKAAHTDRDSGTAGGLFLLKESFFSSLLLNARLVWEIAADNNTLQMNVSKCLFRGGNPVMSIPGWNLLGFLRLNTNLSVWSDWIISVNYREMCWELTQ